MLYATWVSKLRPVPTHVSPTIPGNIVLNSMQSINIEETSVKLALN